MSTIYLLYLHDCSVPNITAETPEYSFNLGRVFPMLWIGVSTSVNISNIIYEKRAVYKHFKTQKRYYNEYMDLFKYLDNNAHNVDLSIEIMSLESGLPTNEIINDRLSHHLFIYRIFYGCNLILNKEYRDFLTIFTKRASLLEPLRLHHDPSVPPEERKKLSAKKYTETHREKLNAKSRRYYQRNKELIKEKRLSKIAEISNTAQPNSEIST